MTVLGMLRNSWLSSGTAGINNIFLFFHSTGSAGYLPGHVCHVLEGRAPEGDVEYCFYWLGVHEG